MATATKARRKKVTPTRPQPYYLLDVTDPETNRAVRFKYGNEEDRDLAMGEATLHGFATKPMTVVPRDGDWSSLIPKGEQP